MMSRPTHHSDPASTCITTPLSNNITNNRLEEAKKAFCSLTISERSKPQHLDELWQQLRRSYEAVNTHDGQPFPYWALENLPLDKIAALIRMAYVEDLGAIQMHASRMPPYFNTDSWKSVLFFDYIEHGRGRVLRKIYKKRPTITLEQMYEEVRRNQLNRLSAPNVLNWRPRNPRAYFHISDYKSCLRGSNDEEIVNDSEAEIETGDEDNENIGQDETKIETGANGNNNILQEPYFQPINENLSTGHQESDNIDGYKVENSHDQGGLLKDNLDGIGTQDEGDPTARDDADDTSASSPQANLPTPATNSPIATPDDLKPQPLGGPAREANAMEDGSLTITDPLQDEARRQDVDQTPPSSPDIYSTVRSFVDSERPRLDRAAKQLKNEQKRFEDAESILADLDKLEEEDAVKRDNIKGFISEDVKAQAEWNSWLGLTSDENISVEECLSRAKSSILDAKERKTKRQAEESEIAKNKNKRAKLKAKFKDRVATSANREPSLPIRSLEPS